ncbi:hypothetical protein AB6A40_011349 [Gnathostoma spinigerum]|uniref:Uncharacterized protein n=1 Tax=Gnathostoma spinigerum TaxID=75299 RepID=A0ABD6EYW0_9BILA
MNLWIEFGDEFPFINDTLIRISLIDESVRKNITELFEKPKANVTQYVTFEDLRPSGWYTIDICLIIEPPNEFERINGFSLHSYAWPVCKKIGYHTNPIDIGIRPNYSPIFFVSFTTFFVEINSLNV